MYRNNHTKCRIDLIWRTNSLWGNVITNTTHSVSHERRNNAILNQKIKFSDDTFPELVITASTTSHKSKLWYLTCKEKIYFPYDIPDVNLQVRCSYYTSERRIDKANQLYETNRYCETCYIAFWSNTNTEETSDSVTTKEMYYNTIEDIEFDLYDNPGTFGAKFVPNRNLRYIWTMLRKFKYGLTCMHF